VLGQASPMIQEMFPGRVAAAAAAGFVGLLSLFNMAGRFCWSSLSDYIGRKSSYTIFFLLGAALYGLTPQTGPLGLLVLFVLGYGIIISMYGGGFATVPAYLRDLFGTAQVGAIHGRLLTAWSAAGIAGPVLVNYIREFQIESGVPREQAYTVTMYIMAGLLMIGLVCNLLVRPLLARGATPHRPEADELTGGVATGMPRESAAAQVARNRTAESLPRGMSGEPAVQDSEATPGDGRGDDASRNSTALLTISWLWVGVPLAWGVLETLRTSLALFH
jgi:MFS family permease